MSTTVRPTLDDGPADVVGDDPVSTYLATYGLTPIDPSKHTRVPRETATPPVPPFATGTGVVTAGAITPLVRRVPPMAPVDVTDTGGMAEGPGLAERLERGVVSGAVQAVQHPIDTAVHLAEAPVQAGEETAGQVNTGVRDVLGGHVRRGAGALGSAALTTALYALPAADELWPAVRAGGKVLGDAADVATSGMQASARPGGVTQTLVRDRVGAVGRQPLTEDLARSAGKDAGNRSMRNADRTAWNAEDYHAAATETNRLLDLVSEPPAAPPRSGVAAPAVVRTLAGGAVGAVGAAADTPAGATKEEKEQRVAIGLGAGLAAGALSGKALDVVAPELRKMFSDVYAPIRAQEPELHAALHASGAMPPVSARRFVAGLTDMAHEGLSPGQVKLFGQRVLLDNFEAEAKRKAAAAVVASTPEEQATLRAAAMNFERHAATLRAKLPLGVETMPWFQDALAKTKQHVQDFTAPAAIGAGVDPATFRQPSLGLYMRLVSQDRLNEQTIRSTQAVASAMPGSTVPRSGLALRVQGQPRPLTRLLPQGASAPVQGPENVLRDTPPMQNFPPGTAATASRKMASGAAHGYVEDFKTAAEFDAADKVAKTQRNQVYQAIVRSAMRGPAETVSLYHGSPESFAHFAAEHATETGLGEKAHFFADTPELAKAYGPNVTRVDVPKDRILDLTSAEAQALPKGGKPDEAIRAKGYLGWHNPRTGEYGIYDPNAIPASRPASKIRELPPDQNAPSSMRSLTFNDRHGLVDEPSDGEAVPAGFRRFAVPKEVGEAMTEYQKQVRGGSGPPSIVKRAASGLTSLMLKNPVIAYGHEWGLASNVSMGLPADAGTAKALATGLPLERAALTVQRMRAVDFQDPGTIARLHRLARSGALRVSPEGTGGWLDFFHQHLFGPTGADPRARLVASEDFESMWKQSGANPKDPLYQAAERDYVTGHAGNYVGRNQGSASQWLQDAGITPFIAIRSARYGTAARAMMGSARGLTPTLAQRAQLAARGPLATAAALTGAGYLVSGHTAAANAPGHETDMATGVYHVPDTAGVYHPTDLSSYRYFRGSPEEAAQRFGADAKEVYVKKGFADPTSASALRVLEPIATAKPGDKVSELLRGGVNELAGFLGPAVTIPHAALTGTALYIDRDGELGKLQGVHILKDDALPERARAVAREVTAGAAIAIPPGGGDQRSGLSSALGSLTPASEARAGSAPRASAMRGQISKALDDGAMRIARERDPVKRQAILTTLTEDFTRTGVENDPQVRKGMVRLRREAMRNVRKPVRPIVQDGADPASQYLERYGAATGAKP